MKLLFVNTVGLSILVNLLLTVTILEAKMSETLPLKSSPLDTRTTDPWHFCGDSNWKVFGERAFLAGLRLMGRTDDYMIGFSQNARNVIPNDYTVQTGMCTNLWCGGDQKRGLAVLFYFCVNSTTPATTKSTQELAQKFHNGFHDCNGKREPQDDGDNTVMAYHVWDNGWDLHVEGVYDGMKCPGDMNKPRWPRPASLYYVPYTEKPRPL